MSLLDKLRGGSIEQAHDDGDVVSSVAIIPLGGGSILGLEQAGIKTVAAAELNEGWTAGVRLNRPEIPYVTDLAEWEEWAETLREDQPTVVHGIPPCQGFSGMSRTSAADNAKNQWLLHATRAAMVIKPEYVIFENIPRALSIGKSVVNEMVDIARRNAFTVSIHRHNVMDFGVGQRRKRVLFVMEQKGKEHPWPSHPTSKSPTVWEALSDLDEIEPQEDPTEVAYADEAHNSYQQELRNPDGFTWNHDLTTVPERFSSVPVGKQWLAMPEEEMTEKERGRIKDGRIFNACELARIHPDRVAGTITGARRFIHPYRQRLLSTREASRLMSYPDSWKWAKEKEWQQFAAGVCPPVMRHYGEMIQHFEAGRTVTPPEGRLW